MAETVDAQKTPSRKIGRPRKFTLEVEQRIVQAIEQGAYKAVAAAHAGISARTLYRWLEQGEADDEQDRDTVLPVLARRQKGRGRLSDEGSGTNREGC